LARDDSRCAPTVRGIRGAHHVGPAHGKSPAMNLIVVGLASFSFAAGLIAAFCWYKVGKIPVVPLEMPGLELTLTRSKSELGRQAMPAT
jgi:hypothetical protein